MTLHLAVPGPTGGWLAVVRSGNALIVRPGGIPAADLYAALGSDDPVRGAIERLTTGGFAATPDFGLVARSSSGPLHVVVRGPVEIVLPDGVVSGAEVSTWTERVVAGGAEYEIRAPEGSSEDEALPLADGVVWASAVRTGSAAAPTSMPSAENAVPGAAAPAAPDVPLGPDAADQPAAGAAGAGEPMADTPSVDGPGEGLPDADAPDAGVPAADVPDADLPEVAQDPADEPAADSPSADEPADSPSSDEPGTDEPTADESPVDDSIPEDTVVTEFPVSEDTVLPHEERMPAAEPPSAPDLDESTIVRPVDGDPPMPPTVAFDVPAASAASDEGDHDGMTVMSGDVEGLAGRARPTDDEIARPDADPGYVVVLPDGTREPLDGEMLIGRSPSGRVTGGATPRLVTLSGDPDISRTHVRIALEGDTVVVTDMHSRNGTTLQLAGKSPQLLRAGEPATVIPGTVVDLGGGTLLRVEASG